MITASAAFEARAVADLDALRASARYKELPRLSGPMGPTATVDGRELIVLCSNDYLGLANHPEVVAAGTAGLARYGAGTASVRFICGTLDAHVELEAAVADLVGADAALSYVSCWTANEALLPTVVAPGDTIVSDELNHASIIDATRLVRGVDRIVYRHGDLGAVERALAGADDGVRWVVTDGVFSMEGDVAPLPELVGLCRRYGAMLVVDDSHAVGVLGAGGRGTAEHFGLLGEVDVLTGTLGKALGGGAGGYVAGSAALVELLVQRSRPSLFSNALPATIACSAAKAVDLLRAGPDRVARLHRNAKRLRAGLRGLGFDCADGPSAIIPIRLGDDARAASAATRLRDLGLLVTGFSFPVVPRGEARLRVQASAVHDDTHIDAALDAFGRL
jgi:glycine C-acetyltransferase